MNGKTHKSDTLCEPGNSRLSWKNRSRRYWRPMNPPSSKAREKRMLRTTTTTFLTILPARGGGGEDQGSGVTHQGSQREGQIYQRDNSVTQSKVQVLGVWAVMVKRSLWVK